MAYTTGADITGKRIIVTGGTSGMGKTLVEAFPGMGANIVFFGRNEARGSALAKDTGARFIPVDVTEEAAVDAAMEEAVKHLGGLDVLVHAAGIAPAASAEAISLAQWQEVMATNATSTFLTNVAAFPHLQEGGGAILNFTSAGGIQGYPGKAHYAASKGAVTAWIRSLAKEWGKYNIRVNGVAPAIWTPMYDKTRSEMDEEALAAHDRMLQSAIPLGGRLGNTEADYLPVMRFLCSDDARFMTGQMFAIDGGALMLR